MSRRRKLKKEACVSRLDWNFDRAGSDERLRARPSRGGEVVAYFDGRWFVCVPGRDESVAQGTESSLEAAQRRAVSVYRSLLF